MTKQDLYWSLGGLVLGLGIAANTLQQKGYTGGSFDMGRLTGNVVGGVLIAFIVGRIVRHFSKKG